MQMCYRIACKGKIHVDLTYQSTKMYHMLSAEGRYCYTLYIAFLEETEVFMCHSQVSSYWHVFQNCSTLLNATAEQLRINWTPTCERSNHCSFDCISVWQFCDIIMKYHSKKRCVHCGQWQNVLLHCQGCTWLASLCFSKYWIMMVLINQWWLNDFTFTLSLKPLVCDT